MNQDEMEKLHTWVVEQLRHGHETEQSSDAELLAEIQRVARDARSMCTIFRTPNSASDIANRGAKSGSKEHRGTPLSRAKSR